MFEYGEIPTPKLGKMKSFDYFIFGSMLILSVALGLLKGRDKQGNASTFLQGGGKLSTLPVGLSMIASFLSSITLLGQAAEVYLYGTQQWLFGISFLLVIPTIGNFMVPMFREKNYTSAYQYFGERFSRRVQFITSALFTINTVIYTALVLYAPAMAVNQATGMNTMAMVTLMYAVCIIYTSVGGITAVVWTDSFQVGVTILSLIFILAKGTLDAGGFGTVWEKNHAANRTIFFNFSYDVTERYTFWSVLLGLGFFHIAVTGANQFQIQRFTLVSSNNEAKKMLWIYAVGWTLVVFICTYAGMLIFAVYKDCDPITSLKISKADYLFPLYIIERQPIPGILGLFLSGIFSAGLSTVSTGINSLAAIWFAELEGTDFKKGLNDAQSGSFIKVLAAVLGLLSYLPVFIIPYLGGLVPLAISFSSIFIGSLFSVFMLGMLTELAEEWGALLGMLSSSIILSWLHISSSMASNGGLLIHDVLPLSTGSCSNHTDIYRSMVGHDYAPWYLRISHTWYCLIAATITFAVGISTSFIVQILKPPKIQKVDILLEQVKAS